MKIEKNLLADLVNNEHTLENLQIYFEKVFEIRGFSDQTVSDKLLLLTEEVGELAKAIRKSEGKVAIDKARIKDYPDILEEIADVFIILISICEKLNLDLFECIKKKEEVNIQRTWSK